MEAGDSRKPLERNTQSCVTAWPFTNFVLTAPLQLPQDKLVVVAEVRRNLQLGSYGVEIVGHCPDGGCGCCASLDRRDACLRDVHSIREFLLSKPAALAEAT